MHRAKACRLGRFLLPVTILDESRSAEISAAFGALLCRPIPAVSSGVDSSLWGVESSNSTDSWEAAGSRFSSNGVPPVILALTDCGEGKRN